MQRPVSKAVSASGSVHPHDRQAPAEALGAVVDELRADLKTLFPVPPARLPSTRRKRIAAAGSALVLLLGAGLWWMDPAYRAEAFASQVGQVIDVKLADGSQLSLDTGSRVRVQWHLRSRRVLLEQGRVHFDVAHSALRPFLVDAGAAQVRVVGTRFDVWRHVDSTQVWVYQGRVAVWRSGEPVERGIQLTPGQQLNVGKDSGTTTLPLQALPFVDDGRQAWRQGRLVFNDTPLGEVVATLQRYRQAPVSLADSRLDRLTLSGVFEINNTEQLLAMLPATLPVALRRTSDGAVEILPR